VHKRLFFFFETYKRLTQSGKFILHGGKFIAAINAGVLGYLIFVIKKVKKEIEIAVK